MATLKAFLQKLGLLSLAQRCWCAVNARTKGICLLRRADAIHVRRGRDEILIGRRHEVYLNDMITFFDHYFSAVVPEENDGRRRVDFTAPKLHRLQASGVDFEFPSLPEADESIETYLTALQPKPGEVVFDLGAYAGASTYFLSKAVGRDGLVAAFEPDETNLGFLKANVERHGLTNVKIFDCGIWSENSILAFQSEGNMGSSVSTILGRNSNVHQVKVVSLEEAVRLSGRAAIACIKMDIEGAEVEVLKSAAEFLRKHQPRLIIETHFVGGHMTTREVTEILRRCGYKVEMIPQGAQEWPLVAARPV